MHRLNEYVLRRNRPPMYDSQLRTIHDVIKGTYSAQVESGTEVSLVVATQYPYGNGVVDIALKASRRGPKFPVNIRIPSWSKNCKITVDLKMVR